MNHFRAVKRAFLEQHPEYQKMEVVLVNTLNMGDPYHDKSLRDHTGFHPITMKSIADEMGHATMLEIAESISTWYDSDADWDLLIVSVCKKERHRSIAHRELLMQRWDV